MEAIGLFLALSGFLHALGWVLLGAVLTVVFVVGWLWWLFKWNKLGDGD